MQVGVNFSITQGEIRGPFNLHHTMQSGQTSEPYWRRQNETYRDVDFFNGQPALLDVYPSGDPDNASLQIHVTGEHLDEETLESIRSYLVNLFRLCDDLPLFYKKFRNEKISQAFKEFCGLRLMKASNPFESLICSVCSQHSSVEQWNKTIRCIQTFFGQLIDLPDGQTFNAFPSPEALAKASTAKLEGCQAGYRAQYILSVSKKIVNGDLNLDELRNASYETAKNELMELPGIGPKVADCFLLYGLGQTRAAPVDIWIHRIVPKVYFGGAKMSKEEVGRFLRSRYGEWAGLAQLYLYHYGRMRSSKLFPPEKKLV